MIQNKFENLFVIGVTGGIGSGKSTVTRLLDSNGEYTIDADKIAKEIMEKGSPALQKIHESFGDSVFFEDGSLDRQSLSKIVFSNKDQLDLLNSITHPIVAGMIRERLGKISEEIGKHKNKNTAKPVIAVVDVPIPIEIGFIDVCDLIVVVSTSLEIRIQRIMERNSFSRELALERINSQMSDEQYRSIAQVIIENDGTVEELAEKVNSIYRNNNGI